MGGSITHLPRIQSAYSRRHWPKKQNQLYLKNFENNNIFQNLNIQNHKTHVDCYNFGQSCVTFLFLIPKNKGPKRMYLFKYFCTILYTQTHTYIYYHHHHVVLVAWISLTLSRHFSLSFIASGRSSGQHPVSSHSCWMYVRAGRPAFARPYVGVHKST